MKALEALDAARREPSHGRCLGATRQAAAQVHEALQREPPVLCVRTLPLSRLAYPTTHALQGAAWSPAPFVQLAHRCLLVQFREAGVPRLLLFNPTDIVGARATPFFVDFIRAIGRLEPYLAPRSLPLETQLASLGVTPEQIDYVAFDHFHTQDLRSLLGTTDGAMPPRFANATLLAPRTEWTDWDDLHPMQRAWYVRDGKRGVRQDRVRLLDGSLHLGDGVVLARTPGHTSGNQTLFLRTATGVWGCSENGTSADNWSPHASAIPGVARFARKYDLEVLINANTPELGAAQYTSMIAERTIVDAVVPATRTKARAQGYVQMFPSSEMCPSAVSPGVRPTFRHEAITAGALVRTAQAGRQPAAEHARA